MALPPAISVIIPTCYRPELVIDCITSILQNDFTDFEILVVDQDPAKTLKTKLLYKFGDEPRILYFFLEVAALDCARNMGIDYARGQIIVFADDDVEVDKGWLRAYVDAFSIQPAPGIVGGCLEPLWLHPKPEWLPEERAYVLGIYNNNNCDKLVPMPDSDLPIGANFAVLREVIDKVGRFDERLDYSYSRKASMLSGGDSLFALKVKQANYTIHYQPAARAWHKISEKKLNIKYFLKRNYWEGVTLLAVLYLSGCVHRDSAFSIIQWHTKAIVSQVWCLLFPKAPREDKVIHSKTLMRTLSECVSSAGVIYSAVKLSLTGQLP